LIERSAHRTVPANVEGHGAPVVEGGGAAIIERARNVLSKHGAGRNGSGICVTLTFAQSLDGCIAACVGSTTPISGKQSLTVTHGLRAIHDAILIGVNTALVDDPQLNVRLVEGDDPRPVVVDSCLKISPDARVFQRRDARPIIATTRQASERKAARLTAAGAEVLRVPSNRDGRVDLAKLVDRLRQLGIRTLMVEGGARIITSILSKRLADQAVLTISPTILGGVHAVEALNGMAPEARPRLHHVSSFSLGGDIVVHGEFDRARCS